MKNETLLYKIAQSRAYVKTDRMGSRELDLSQRAGPCH